MMNHVSVKGTLLAAASAMIMAITSCSGPEPTRLEVYRASVRQSEEMVNPAPLPHEDQITVYLETAPTFTEQDFVHATPATVQADGSTIVQLTLSEHGRDRIAALNDSIVNDFLAFAWDGNIISCPIINTKLNDKLLIVTDETSPTSRGSGSDLAEISTRINTLAEARNETM